MTSLCEITIKGQGYGVEQIPAGEDGTKAFVLTKRDGTNYAVIRTHAGLVECDCPDYEARHRGLDCLPCKHGKALVELGFLEAPRPVPIAPALPTSNVRSARLNGETRRQSVQEARPSVPSVETSEVPAPCCDDSEPAPCAACASAEAAHEPTAADLAEMGRWSAGEDVEAESDPAGWPAWTDAERWVPTDDQADNLLTLDELVDHEADRYRRIGTLAGEMIARHLAELASMVRFVHASTPATAMDRIATMERDSLRERFAAL